MARAVQLPSGSWRVRVYDKETKQYLSITADTEREANYQALEYQLGKNRKARIGDTVGEAVDKYIAVCRVSCSPSTVAEYERMRKSYLQDLMNIPVKKLDKKTVQEAFDKQAQAISRKTKKPISSKTLDNIRGLFTASMEYADDSIHFNIKIKDTPKKIIKLPEPKAVIDAVRDTDIELPALLAAWLSLSVSEIRGIQVSAISDGTLSIKESIVQVHGQAVSKENMKEEERTRVHAIPPRIMRLIERTDAWKAGVGYIEPRSGKAITSRFQRVISKAGIPHMRFHDLRHINASVMKMLEIPDTYAMERGGWKTDYTLKRVYQHTFSKERAVVDAKVDAYFESLF